MAGGEIDLHGLTVAEALSRLAAHYNARLRAGDTGPIRVIHGYGSSGRGGDLRTAIRELLSRHAGRLEFVPGRNVLQQSRRDGRLPEASAPRAFPEPSNGTPVGVRHPFPSRSGRHHRQTRPGRGW